MFFWKQVHTKKPKVCIALSGGVDSSVAAYLLQKEGYDVVAAFIKVWQPDFLPCSQEEDRVAAKRVAASLGIPFFVVDAAEEYKKGIVEYMVDSYSRGETPNPDVTCNKVIKFGALWKWAQAHGCEYIATGHHAQVDKKYRIKNKEYTLPRLLRGADPAKDQAYFLWELTNEDLSHTLLPIGHMQKSEVREIARRANLPSAARKDSQGLCFLGALSMGDFLDHLIPKKDGNVLSDAGTIIGEHDGTHHFTLGQRGGFRLHTSSPAPLYVTALDAHNNTITVSEDPLRAARSTFSLRSVVLRSTTPPTEAEVRYHGERIPVLSLEHKGAHVSVTFAHPVVVSPGQSCVFYCGEECIGGGVVGHGE